MTGTAEMTVSPWSCMIMRKTPWVLGCCGPRLSVIRFSSSTMPSAPGASKMVSPSSGLCAGVRPLSTSVSVMGWTTPLQSVRLVHELFDGDVLKVGLVVAPHREADEVVGQQDFAQVGVAEEADAHHLVGFALQELGARPDRGDRRDGGHRFAGQVGPQDN